MSFATFRVVSAIVAGLCLVAWNQSGWAQSPGWDGNRPGFAHPVEHRPAHVTVRSQGRILPGHHEVVGSLGARYALVVHNPNLHRVVAMVSVDGLSVFTGKPSTDHDPGYVLEPRQSVVVRGWRRGNEHAAAFRFSRDADSYAARMGYHHRLGVIDVTLVMEAPAVPRAATGARSLSARGGTEYGEEIRDRVRWVNFRRSAIHAHTSLRYRVATGGVHGVPSRHPEPFAPAPPGYEPGRGRAPSPFLSPRPEHRS